MRISSRTVTALRVWSVIAVTALVAGCVDRDVRGPFRNQYVDAETGKPIEGVVFLAVWSTATVNPVDGGGESFYEAREAASGPDGRVEIPALGGAIWSPTLDVRFHEFAPGGYVGERVEVTPSDSSAYIAQTVTFMRRLQTPEQRCQRLPLAAGMISAVAAQSSRRYMEALANERSVVGCSEAGQVSP